DYPRVRMFDLSGNYLGEFNGDKTGVDYTLNNPQGIFAYGGMLYVADTENNRIVIYNITTGEVVGKLGRGPGDAIAKRPTRVFADEGIILVSDTGNNRIMVFYSNFTYAGSFGSFGNGTNKFSSPIGIFVQNKTLFVADSGNNKIKIYRIGGEGTGESINISETQARLAINSANETLAKLVSLSRSAAEIGLGADILDIQIRIADAVSAKSAGDYERAKEYADEANALATARVDELKKAIEREIGVRISACREMLRLADGNNTAYGLDIDAQGLQASIENTMREISSGNHEQAVMWVKLAEGNRTVVGVLLAASQAGVEARKSILQSRVYKAQEGINAIGVLAIAYNYSVETAELERRINDTILEIEAGRLESANDTLSELETEINRTIDGLYAKIKAVDKARNAIRRAKEEIAKGEAGLIKANMGDAIKEMGEAEVILYSDPAKAEEKALHAVNMARVENEKTEKIKSLLTFGGLICSLAVFIAVAGIVLMLIKKRKK
ncbi:MAG: NHL repeat-containing protein, partial [Candidatus Micrarchaeia archaeon]